MLTRGIRVSVYSQIEEEWGERIDALSARLSEARAIIDRAAAETMLDQHPYHAIALLNEDEQKRLYALLKGDE